MADEKPKELSLELGEGECRVLVDGLALNIALKAARREAVRPPALLPEPTEAMAAEKRRLSEDLNYYRQTSMDIYTELGQLAKKLNVGLQDITVAEAISCQIDSPGEQLDRARIQVKDVLEMTEKATLNIMDLVEQIREDCDALRQHLLSMGPQDDGWEAEPAAEPKPVDPGSGDQLKAFMAQVMAQGQELDRRMHTQAPAAPSAPTEAPAPAEASLHFPLAEILQIVLEFCGNEPLKQHLKGVIAKQGEIFRTAEAEAAFARLGASQPPEDGFSQFPVEEVLKILQSTCEDNRFKDLFGKILASAGKVFPMPILPLEGHPVEAAPAPAPAEPQEPSFLPMWADFFQKLQQLAAQVETAPEITPLAAGPVEAGKIQETIGLLDHITTALSRIMESLSFQDLSGQRLLQLLKLLRQLQFQILSMVVAAGTKLKKKTEQTGITLEESVMLAQDEIDRMLQTLAPVSLSAEAPEGPVEDQVLDQEAINDLLTNMGF